MASTLSVRTRANEADLWSPGTPNGTTAANFAGIAGKKTLADTELGQFLGSVNLYAKFGKDWAKMLWVRASVRFVEQASGELWAVVKGSADDSIYKEFELPAAVENPAITRINER